MFFFFQDLKNITDYLKYAFIGIQDNDFYIPNYVYFRFGIYIADNKYLPFARYIRDLISKKSEKYNEESKSHQAAFFKKLSNHIEGKYKPPVNIADSEMIYNGWQPLKVEDIEDIVNNSENFDIWMDVKKYNL